MTHGLQSGGAVQVVEVGQSFVAHVDASPLGNDGHAVGLAGGLLCVVLAFAVGVIGA